MIIKTNQLCEITGVTRRTIAEWVKAGMPKTGHGSFELEQTLTWWRQNILDAGGETVSDSKRKFWAARARREEMQADLDAKAVMPVDEVISQAAQCARLVKSVLNSIPDRLSSLLAAEMDQHKIKKMLKDELRNALLAMGADGSSKTKQ